MLHVTTVIQSYEKRINGAILKTRSITNMPRVLGVK
jgi:hypothetical protein